MTRTGTPSAEFEQPARKIVPAMHNAYPYIAAALVILLLASVARFYHRDTGFTSLIAFRDDGRGLSETLQRLPHYAYPPSSSYDGQFYAQRAFDPLLRDPAIDSAMDNAPFRARRILFSWTAYALGLGRPAWILEAYALQNLLCWLLLAGLLTRWVSPTSARGLALWAACLFSHGMLWSVRFSLLDGPSLLLIACAVAAVERGRPLLSAAIVGIAGLGRETNLLTAFAQPHPDGMRSAVRLALALTLAVLPLLVWYDYLWSIYRSTLLTGSDSFVAPGAGLAAAWTRVAAAVTRDGLSSPAALAVCLLVSMAVQALFVVTRLEFGVPWWRIGVAYAAMMLILNPTLVHPGTGALTRVLLPMTVGFNILLASERRPTRFWSWFAAGNLHLGPALLVLR